MKIPHSWWKEAAVYQIYPRSFADSNGDGIGDLNGITAHLDYLKELGVDVLWLSPIYKSPMFDNGYDVEDYFAINPEFGTMEDFDRLLAEAHRRGIRILMDLVVNHTSHLHRFFRESRKSRDNPYRDFYYWRDPKPDGSPPNNWGAVFGGSTWEWDEATGQYYLHMFAKEQPDLNWQNPAVRAAVYDMMRWWCDKGIDGFRMDTTAFLGKSGFADGAPIPGSPYGEFASQSLNQPIVHTYLQEMREKVLSHYDIMIVGECGGSSTEDTLKYSGLDGRELNMVFGFEHVDAGVRRLGKWTDVSLPMPELRAILNQWQINLQGRAWNALYLDNHDQPRMVSRFGNDSPQWRERSAKMLAVCLYCQQGTPYLYQGEELGMTNAYFRQIEDYRDIEVLNAWDAHVKTGQVEAEDMLRYFGQISRDNGRTPMQWENAPGGGFTTGTPWIPLCRNLSEINAADQTADPDSVFHFYRRLLTLRRESPALVYGSFAPLLEEDDAIYAYRRELDGQSLTIACNFTDQSVPCPLFADGKGEVLLCNYQTPKNDLLRPYEARIVRG